MECEIAQRPHTVGSVPKAYAKSEAILKLLKQIHEEAKGPVEKPKPPQKNYLKENLRKLREIEAKSKERTVEKQPLQPLRVPNRYAQTQSKIYNEETSLKDKLHPPKTAGPYRTGQRNFPCINSKSEEHTNLKTYRSLPRLNHPEVFNEESDMHEKAFRSQNTNQKKEYDTKSEAKHKLGRIPNYLTERKKQWEVEREKQLKLIAEASVPAGYTLLPDDERVETLELLKKNQEELIRTLSTLPVRSDTVRLKNYKEELERQLAKVEEGIKIFSRPKVLIKNDA